MTDVFQTPSSCAEPRPCPCVSLASETGCIDLGIGRSVHLDEEVHQFCCTDGGVSSETPGVHDKNDTIGITTNKFEWRKEYVYWLDGWPPAGPLCTSRTKFCRPSDAWGMRVQCCQRIFPWLQICTYVLERTMCHSLMRRCLSGVAPNSIRQVPFCTASAQTQDVF
jgi:hypothetical protein